MLYREEKPTKGQVMVGGINVAKLYNSKVYKLRRKLGIVFQDYRLLPKLTVYENVAFALECIGEKKDDIRQKVLKALEHGLTPILCCGESLEQREMGVTMDWIRLQIKSDLVGVTADQVKGMVIAYEPIWAIGTGKTATTEQAQEVCKGIRECIAEIYDEATAEAVRIQYGGSVNAGNAAELFAQPDIDGGLVGGASLKAEFGQIVNYK